MPVHDAILAHLDACGAPYRSLQHEPTRTSQDSARVRGEPMEIGGKSLVLKAADRFVVLVISAARRAHSKSLRTALGVRRLRFATTDELLELTGCVPGCVPPFGRPIIALPLWVDASILANERIAFNPGSLTDSVIMARADWQRCVEIEAVVDVSEG
ncbi:MAG: YbaK/EbsC family protein [Nannocystales bacterium]